MTNWFAAERERLSYLDDEYYEKRNGWSSLSNVCRDKQELELAVAALTEVIREWECMPITAVTLARLSIALSNVLDGCGCMIEAKAFAEPGQTSDVTILYRKIVRSENNGRTNVGAMGS